MELHDEAACQPSQMIAYVNSWGPEVVATEAGASVDDAWAEQKRQICPTASAPSASPIAPNAPARPPRLWLYIASHPITDLLVVLIVAVATWLVLLLYQGRGTRGA